MKGPSPLKRLGAASLFVRNRVSGRSGKTELNGSVAYFRISANALVLCFHFVVPLHSFHPPDAPIAVWELHRDGVAVAGKGAGVGPCRASIQQQRAGGSHVGEVIEDAVGGGEDAVARCRPPRSALSVTGNRPAALRPGQNFIAGRSETALGWYPSPGHPSCRDGGRGLLR
jgi:hypothetical protein